MINFRCQIDTSLCYLLMPVKNSCVMKPLLTFQDGYISIELSPYQCASLAKACHLACEHSLSAETDHWRSLGQLFQACCVAGLSHWQMSQADLEAVMEQVHMLNVEGWAGSVNGHQRPENEFGS